MNIKTDERTDMNENTDQTTPLNQTNQYYRIFMDETELDGLREQVLSSDYRQTYHIQPVAGLMNDPNGFLYHHGNWHLFYQWCPWGAVHGLKHWYHTVSTDLVHWKNIGLAIAPDQEWENEGAFSGTAISEEDGIRIYYAGNQRDHEGRLVPNVCMAKLYDDGHIEKLSHALIPPHPDYTHDQRDPQIICVQEGAEEKYYILMGARSKDDRGCLLLYASDQRTTGWQFVGQVKVPGYENFGSVWECPSIMRLGEVDLLIFCPQNILLPGRGQAPHHNVYLLGHMDYENCIFQPKGSYQFLDYGYDFYAAQCAAGTASDAPAVMSAWMGLPAAAYPTDSENWSGCLTIPRELTIENGALIQRPPAALKELRGEHRVLSSEQSMKLSRSCEWLIRFQKDGRRYKNPGTANNEGLYEDLTIEKDRIQQHRDMVMDHDVKIHGKDQPGRIELLRLFSTKDYYGGVILSYDSSENMLWIDRSSMTHRFQIDQGEVRGIHLHRMLDSLHGYIDHSSLEIFVNDGEAVITTRIFPTEEESYLVLPEKDTFILSAEVWELQNVQV